MRILCLFISLILVTTVSFCQVDIYAPNQDLLKKHKIKEYTKTHGWFIKGKFEGNSVKHILNKHGMVLYEDYNCANEGCFSKVIYEYINDTILISKTQYPYPYNLKKHFRIYQYKYSNSMILKEEIVFDSLDNLDYQIFYNKNGQLVEERDKNSVTKKFYNSNGDVERLEMFNLVDLVNYVYLYQYEKNQLKQISSYEESELKSVTNYVYDRNSNLVSQHNKDSNSKITFSKLYKYDKQNKVIRVRQIFNGEYKEPVVDSIGVLFDDVYYGVIYDEFFKYNSKGLLNEVVFDRNDNLPKFMYKFTYKI